MDEKRVTPDCPCTGDCGRHGLCDQCVAHHRSIGTLTVCMRPVAEKLYADKKEA